jgi:hypothetical protein
MGNASRRCHRARIISALQEHCARSYSQNLLPASNKTSLVMNIRHAVPSDYDAIATVATQAMLNDDMDAYLFPDRHDHPEAYHKPYLSYIKAHSKEPQCFVVVAESKPTDVCWNGQPRIAGQPQIAGYCLWVREGENTATKERWRTKEEFSTSALRLIPFFHVCVKLQLTLLGDRGPASA